MFILGVDPASPYNLHMYKIAFLSTSVIWANQVACSSGTWTASYSESVLSSDGSTIYLFFTFGVSKYLYFAGLSVSDGSVATSRYKSSGTVSDLFGSALSGDYVVSTTQSPTFLLWSIASRHQHLQSSPTLVLCLGEEWSHLQEGRSNY